MAAFCWKCPNCPARVGTLSAFPPEHRCPAAKLTWVKFERVHAEESDGGTATDAGGADTVSVSS